MGRHSPSSFLLRIGAAILIAAIAGSAPGAATATVVTSAGNIPYSGISPGGVNMATGELILVLRPDLGLDGPFPVVFRRYYASMLAREGLASGHLGPNWLGTYDWSLSVVGSNATLVTNRGAAIRFTQSPVGSWDLVSPTYAKFRLDVLAGGTWRVTNPLDRRLYFFDGTSWLLTQIMDEHGNALSLSYIGGRLTQVSDGLGRALQFGYDPTGLLTAVSDGTQSVHYAYTGGILTSALDAAGQTWTYAYVQPGPNQGLLTGVTEPFGNTPLTHAYDPMGRVMSQTDGLGGMAMYAYDAPPGNVFTDPLGNMWTYLHDTQNRLMTLTDPASDPTSFAYDALGRISMVTRPMGDQTFLGYDSSSGYENLLRFPDLTAITSGYSSHLVAGAALFDLATVSYPDGTMESYGRDGSGNLTDLTDQAGLHWTGTYNARGQILTWTNPSSGVTTFTYDPQGRPATEKDNAGNITNYSYDGLSRLTQVTWPDATHRNYAYDNLDGLTSLTDERAKVWSYAYDSNERLMTETDPLSEATGYLYDALDRVTQVVDPLGHATGYAYDPAGRLMTVTDRSGRATGYQHDTVGRLTGIVDPAGGTDQFAYDTDSRVISEQDPLGHASSYGYDMLDRVTHITDPVGTGFDYGYDSMGRLTSASDPLEAPESYGYDSRGLLNLAHKFTVEIDLARTPLGEVSQLTDPNRNLWPAAYDPQGRITSSADPLGRTTLYSYDSRSRVTHEELPLGSVNVTYDAAGRMGGRQWSDGTTLTYGYDDANRLTSASGASFSYDAAGRMTNSNGFAMTYDPEGRILSETLAPGKVVSYAYDSRGLPSQVMDWMGGTTTFTYDAARRLTGITRPNGTSATYAYDAANRLINEVEINPGPISTPLSSIVITRDALGQPTSISRRQPLMPGQTMASSSAFTYDPASQLNGVSHDPLGRMTADASRSFQWDGASRLTHYVAGADSPRYAYDAFGQQLTSTQANPAVAQAWNYGRGYPTNDDMQVNLPTPRTSYNVRAPSGLLLYGVNGTTGARSFYHYDEGGNTSFLTNDGGSVVTEYAYTPFGGVAALGETADNAFTYQGAEGAAQLGSSGLFRVGRGIYDATTMRTISGNTTGSGPVGINPGPPSSPGNYPGNSTGNYPGNSTGNYPGNSTGNYPGNSTGNYPGNSPGSWVEKSPGPVQAPGSWVEKSPGPSQSPGSWVGKSPGPQQSPGVGGPLEVSWSFWLGNPAGTSGIAEISGNDAIISLTGPSFAPSGEPVIRSDAGTLMHEIGHNLRLVHEGPSDNLPSAWETAQTDPTIPVVDPVGVDRNCNGQIDGGDWRYFAHGHGGHAMVVPHRPLLPPSPISMSEPGWKRPPRDTLGVEYGVWLPVFTPGSYYAPCTWCAQ